MLQDLDLGELRRIPRIAYYFRYPLHHKDFHELRSGNSLQGYYTAKPLYGRLTPEGRVDRSAGFNGDVAALFIHVEARTVWDTKLILAHLNPKLITLPNGRRNWLAIREIAEQQISSSVSLPVPSSHVESALFPVGWPEVGT